MMLLFLPFLLVNVASVAQLIEHWECGAERYPFTLAISEGALASCHYSVRDGTNLCCKAHDLCYNVHELRQYKKDYCDERFCHCLQDVSHRTKNFACTYSDAFCSVVGAPLMDVATFHPSKPVDHTDKFLAFVDQQPLNLSMKSLVDACHHAKAVAVHCHNTAVRCMEKPHERIRREEYVTNSYEDCRSTMYDCLQAIIDTGASDKCTSIAHDYSKRVNNYAQLDESKHGRAIIDTYPIVAARLLKQCPKSTNTLKTCFLTFDACSQNNPRKDAYLYIAARKTMFWCHSDLKGCIFDATSPDYYDEACTEATALAGGLIRDVELKEKSLTEKTADLLDLTAAVAAAGVKKAADTVAEGVQDAWHATKDWIGSWSPFGG